MKQNNKLKPNLDTTLTGYSYFTAIKIELGLHVHRRAMHTELYCIFYLNAVFKSLPDV